MRSRSKGGGRQPQLTLMVRQLHLSLTTTYRSRFTLNLGWSERFVKRHLFECMEGTDHDPHKAMNRLVKKAVQELGLETDPDKIDEKTSQELTVPELTKPLPFLPGKKVLIGPTHSPLRIGGEDGEDYVLSTPGVRGGRGRE